MHLLITDSGLGGLSVCAAAARALPARITYFNAWPEPASGYNDMPDIRSRAEVFDRALAAMAALRPDRIVIACNTLSIVYEHTSYSRSPAVPVLGIVDAGVDLFLGELAASPAASIVLVGTRTTIESGAHRDRLMARGVAPGRIATVACHGLAKAIETDFGGETVAGFIETCTRAAAGCAPAGGPLYLGVCCTHYTYVRDDMAAALERHSRRQVRALDPGDRLVEEIVRGGAGSAPTDGTAGDSIGAELARGGSVEAELAPPRESRELALPRVSVVSKVEMDDRKRRAMAARVEDVSPATAAALLAYTRVPDLF